MESITRAGGAQRIPPPARKPTNAIALPLFLLFLATAYCRADEDRPVKTLASSTLSIITAHGTAKLPLEISLDWAEPHPEVTRALIVIHGQYRNVEGAFSSAMRPAMELHADTSTIIIAPQFLQEVDVAAYGLGPEMLRWPKDKWPAGEDAVAPSPISSFSAIDEIVQRLDNRRFFPALKNIVIAGHSAGGQTVQRYAVVGRAPKALPATIHVRFVVANPSSYLYFDDTRPAADGTLKPFSAAASCHNFNHWRHGPHGAPDYVGAASFTSLEQAYAASDVIYLLGTADTDPDHPGLDKTCAGEAQGPNRYERGNAYFHYMQARHPHNTQHFWQVAGVGHDEAEMFSSDCGWAALFDFEKCPTPLR